MIPVLEKNIYEKDLSLLSSLPKDELNKRILANKEYGFCVPLKEEIRSRAEKLYTKTLKKGRKLPYCCDYLLLEKEMKKFI